MGFHWHVSPRWTSEIQPFGNQKFWVKSTQERSFLFYPTAVEKVDPRRNSKSRLGLWSPTKPQTELQVPPVLHICFKHCRWLFKNLPSGISKSIGSYQPQTGIQILPGIIQKLTPKFLTLVAVSTQKPPFVSAIPTPHQLPSPIAWFLWDFLTKFPTHLML